MVSANQKILKKTETIAYNMYGVKSNNASEFHGHFVCKERYY